MPKVPSFESERSLPAGGVTPGGLYLPQTQTQTGQGAVWKQMAQLGDELSQIATRSLLYRQQDNLARLSVKAHQVLDAKEREYRDKTPEEVLKLMPGDFTGIREKMMEGLADPVRNAFEPMFDRIALTYQRTATDRAKTRLDQNALAANIETIRQHLQAVDAVGDPAGKAQLVAQGLAFIDSLAKTPYWNPVNLVAYRKEFVDKMRDVKLYADVFNTPEGAEKVIAQLLKDPAYYGIATEQVPAAIARVQQLRNQREAYAIDQMHKDHGAAVPPEVINQRVAQGQISSTTAISLKRSAFTAQISQEIKADPVKFQIEQVVTGTLARRIPNDPDLVRHLEDMVRREAGQLRRDNSEKLMGMLVSGDPGLPVAMLKAKANMDYHHPQTLKVVDQAMKAEDNFKSDDRTVNDLLIKLSGTYRGPDGNPKVTPEYLVELNERKLLNRTDLYRFMNAIWARSKAEERPQDRVVEQMVADIGRTFKAYAGLPMDLPEGALPSPTYTRYLQVANMAMEDVKQYLRDHPQAGYVELRQVAERHIQAAAEEGQNLYDYEAAGRAGLKPDKTGHWPSRVPAGPEEGLLLKHETHPTFGMTIEKEEAAGYKIYRSPEGRLYSFPQGKKVPQGFIPWK